KSAPTITLSGAPTAAATDFTSASASGSCGSFISALRKLAQKSVPPAMPIDQAGAVTVRKALGPLGITGSAKPRKGLVPLLGRVRRVFQKAAVEIETEVSSRAA